MDYLCFISNGVNPIPLCCFCFVFFEVKFWAFNFNDKMVFHLWAIFQDKCGKYESVIDFNMKG